jgi:hypothetical protein
VRTPEPESTSFVALAPEHPEGRASVGVALGEILAAVGAVTALPASRSTSRARNQMRAGRVTARSFVEGLSCLPWPGKSS